MKYGTSKLTGATFESFIKVTFENGVDNPTIHINGLIGDGGGSVYGGHVCMVEAVANMFIDKCEEMKSSASLAMIHNVNHDGVKK